MWDDEEGEGDTGRGLSVLENRREAGEPLNKNSSEEECPLLPADVLPPPSPCLSLGFGALLPSSIQQNDCCNVGVSRKRLKRFSVGNTISLKYEIIY